MNENSEIKESNDIKRTDSVNTGEAFHQNEKYKQNDELIRKARSVDEEESRLAYEKLIELNTGLVKSIALRFMNRGIEFEDLIQIGMLGLMKAISGFDLSRECSFSTYALPVICGEIKRQIRDSGPVKVSRIYKRNAAILLKEKNAILESEGRDANIAELAERCGIEIEEAAISLDSSMPIVSIHDPLYDDSGATLIDSIECERASEEMAMLTDKIALSQEISALPPLWRRIVLLRYFRDKTQSECASILGLTQVKISREEKKILAYLRERLI